MYWIRRSILALAALLAAATLVPSLAEAQLDVASRPFTAAERRRLDEGRLVVRSATRTRGNLRLIGGASWQVIDAPPEAVWTAIRDTSQYRRMLPQVENARVVAQRGRSRTVRVMHEYGIVGAGYHLVMNFIGDRDITFTLDPRRDNAIEAAWGFIQVRPYRGNRTLLAFGVMADVGGGVVSGFLRPTVHEWMLKVPYTMKQYIEGSGRSRYVATATGGRPSRSN